MRQTTAYFAIAAVCVLTLAWFRAPRLESGMARVDVSQLANGQQQFDIRMLRPFSVEIEHELHGPPPARSVSGWQAYSSEPVREEVVAILRSSYDYLRGGYVVRCSFREAAETIHFDGSQVSKDIAAWHPHGWRGTEWTEDKGAFYAEGSGAYVVSVETNEHREFIDVTFRAD